MTLQLPINTLNENLWMKKEEKLNTLIRKYLNQLSRILNIDETELLKYADENSRHKVFQFLKNLWDDNLESNIVNDYYSLTHNGAPFHYFGIKQGEAKHISRFKREIIRIADLLDTYDKVLIETAALIGLKYLRVNKIRYKEVKALALACYEKAQEQLGRNISRFQDTVEFLINKKDVKPQNYREILWKLSLL